MSTRIVEAPDNPIQIEHAWTANTHNSDMKLPVGVGLCIPPGLFGEGLLVWLPGRYPWDSQAGSRKGRQTIEKSATIHGDTPTRGFNVSTVPHVCDKMCRVFNKSVELRTWEGILCSAWALPWVDSNSSMRSSRTTCEPLKRFLRISPRKRRCRRNSRFMQNSLLLREGWMPR